MKKTGYLITNLGTPRSPDVADVRRYLDEFLMDPYVVDTPWLVRRMLLSLFILPSRPRQSAAAYAKIWQGSGPEGSPLLAISSATVSALSPLLDAPVALGMRYGAPSLSDAIASLRNQGAQHLVVAPMYPQFADSTVTTTRNAITNLLAGTDVTTTYLPPFYAAPQFINAVAETIRRLPADSWDHLLLSYHGLPERHLTKADPTSTHCLASEDCCTTHSAAHATCYRHQVMATSTALADALQLHSQQYSVAFQSRLGRLPWLTPYTDETLREMPARGIKRLLVACPAFVADNLETLEEIANEGRDIFLEAGGEDFELIPCLNEHPRFIQFLKDKVEAWQNGALTTAHATPPAIVA